ncbi:hypothetical protein D1007_52244 [Hordeum vulgare]|nr:hypothetical protein D1007_52244 [Hordeum vulgare]
MAKADKYATADSVMRIKVTASDKAVPTPATPKPAGDNRGGQNNYKRKAQQMDSRSNSKFVASMEGETSAPQAGPLQKRSNRKNANWLPKQYFEELLDAPCKIHSGARPSKHTLRQCSFLTPAIARGWPTGSAGAQAARRAPAPCPAPAPPPPPHDDGHLHDDYPHQAGAFVFFTSEYDDKHNLRQGRRQDTGYGAAASSVAPAAAPEVVASPSPATPEAVASSPSRGLPAPSASESVYAAPLEAAAESTPWAASPELPSGS